MKKTGFLVDFHGTIVDANQAWIDAFESLGATNLEEITELVYKKTNRRIICKDIGLDFDLVKSTYRKFLTVRQDIVKLVENLSESGEVIIISHSSRERLLGDIEYIKDDHNLNVIEVYSKENGNKNDVSYIESILENHNYDHAYLIGNDIREDFNNSEKITNVFVPYKKTMVYNSSL